MRNAEVIRQWQILRDVESHRTGVTIHDLSELTGVTTRTIRRDLQALQEAGLRDLRRGRGERDEAVEAGLAAVSHRAGRAVGGRRRGAVPEPIGRRRDCAAGRSPTSWTPRSPNSRRHSTRACASSCPRCREFISTKAGPRASRQTATLTELTRRLFDATRDRHVIDMHYFSAASNRAKSYAAQPYRLALAQGGAYLIAWVPAYDQFRTFAVERIQKLSVKDETFRKTRTLPDDVFGGSLGVFSGPPETIELEFDARVVPVRPRARMARLTEARRTAGRPTAAHARGVERLGAAQLRPRLWRRRASRQTEHARRRDTGRVHARLQDLHGTLKIDDWVIDD